MIKDDWSRKLIDCRLIKIIGKIAKVNDFLKAFTNLTNLSD